MPSTVSIPSLATELETLVRQMQDLEATLRVTSRQTLEQATGLTATLQELEDNSTDVHRLATTSNQVCHG